MERGITGVGFVPRSGQACFTGGRLGVGVIASKTRTWKPGPSKIFDTRRLKPQTCKNIRF